MNKWLHQRRAQVVDMVIQQGLACLPVVDPVRLDIIAQKVQLPLLKPYALLDITAHQVLVPPYRALEDHIVLKSLLLRRSVQQGPIIVEQKHALLAIAAHAQEGTIAEKVQRA